MRVENIETSEITENSGIPYEDDWIIRTSLNSGMKIWGDIILIYKVVKDTILWTQTFLVNSKMFVLWPVNNSFGNLSQRYICSCQKWHMYITASFVKAL